MRFAEPYLNLRRTQLPGGLSLMLGANRAAQVRFRSQADKC